ncbi:MAG TPA: hypothetical protein DCO75_03935 [Fibrobacteres bacterium]|nr:hypothetical protein [Fibrobacterota bacterium]
MSNRSGITTIRSFPGANAEDHWYTYIFFHTITQPEGCGTQFLSIVKVPVRAIYLAQDARTDATRL